MCLDTLGDSRILNRNLEVRECHHLGIPHTGMFVLFFSLLNQNKKIMFYLHFVFTILCHLGGNQVFMLTGKNEIREKKFCADATVPGMPVKLLDCHGEGGNQYWTYDEDVNFKLKYILFVLN